MLAFYYCKIISLNHLVIYVISGNDLNNVTPLQLDDIGLKKKYSSLNMDYIALVKLKTLAKQRGIKGYYKLRKAQFIQKWEAHPDVNEQVLISGLEISRNKTRPVNTSAILDEPIMDDKTPVLQPTPSSIFKSIQKIKDFGNWLLDYIPPKPMVVDEALESFKNLIKKIVQQERYFLPIKRVKICVEEVCDTVWNKRILNEYDPESFLLNSKLPITNLMINTRQTKVKLILSCMMEKIDLKSGEVIAKEAAFQSKTEVNLESTNSNELFSKMKETVLESLAKFQR